MAWQRSGFGTMGVLTLSRNSKYCNQFLLCVIIRLHISKKLFRKCLAVIPYLPHSGKVIESYFIQFIKIYVKFCADASCESYEGFKVFKTTRRTFSYLYIFVLSYLQIFIICKSVDEIENI